MTTPQTPDRREAAAPPFGLLMQVPLVAFFGWLLWALDEWSAVSLDADVYPWLIAGSTGVLVLPWLAQRRFEHGVVPLAWLSFLLLLPRLDNNALKPLLRTAFALPEGLEREAILPRVHAAHAGTPYDLPFVHRDEAERLVLKPRRDPGFSAETLTFVLEDDRLVRVSFSAD
jgi:hypothetical protein